jgi:hypothetical protein
MLQSATVHPATLAISLTYFDDADIEINPEMLIKVSWQTVKKTIEKKVEAYLKQ